jgi:hypothetical protein
MQVLGDVCQFFIQRDVMEGEVGVVRAQTFSLKLAKNTGNAGKIDRLSRTPTAEQAR